MNEDILKGLIEQMQDQFNELRANLAQSDDINTITERVTEIPDHHAQEVTEIPDSHVADLIQDSRSVWSKLIQRLFYCLNCLNTF